MWLFTAYATAATNLEDYVTFKQPQASCAKLGTGCHCRVDAQVGFEHVHHWYHIHHWYHMQHMHDMITGITCIAGTRFDSRHDCPGLSGAYPIALTMVPAGVDNKSNPYLAMSVSLLSEDTYCLES